MKHNRHSPEPPFDALAQHYDEQFTDTVIGQLLRQRTHEQMAQIFPIGSHILEINCGTGEDAAFLAQRGMQVTAIDASAEMIQYAQEKILRLGLEHRVRFVQCRFEALDSVLEPEAVFDGVVSNFGGLNCAETLADLVADLAPRVRCGGHYFLCIMGRWTPWEWVWLGWTGNFCRIWQRICGLSTWRGQTIRYYSPGQMVQIFKPYCRLAKMSGLGFFLPPTYAGAWVACHPKLFRGLNAVEKYIESVPGVPQLSDHFMLVLTRK